MCTALNLCVNDHYFGRNLDLDCSYGEEVCVMPRCFPIHFKKANVLNKHYAIVGMATVIDGIPLFYDGTNEHGLSMAGLNFPNNAYYPPFAQDKDNITPFEFIPWILGQCKTVAQAREMLCRINLVNIPFRESLPLSPLHWIISDSEQSIVVESMENGLHIHNNPVGVLTNNPPFEYQLFNLNNYRNLHTDNAGSDFASNLNLDPYCQGLGLIGLPGDVSSMSRFVRIAFCRENSVCNEDEFSAVSQFFHLLSTVEMTEGICKTEAGKRDITVYSSCVNTRLGIYYYTTYGNRQISCVNMHKTDLNGNNISRFPLITKQIFNFQN